jgi:hypothetical protein
MMRVSRVIRRAGSEFAAELVNISYRMLVAGPCTAEPSAGAPHRVVEFALVLSVAAFLSPSRRYENAKETGSLLVAMYDDVKASGRWVID